MKKAPWRWAVGLVSAAVIVYMWSTKDVADSYVDLPREELLPLLAANIAVTLVKVLAIAAVVWLARRLAAKWDKGGNNEK